MSKVKNFVCLESWYTMIKGYENAGDLAMAEKLAHQIITYGITGEVTTDNPIIASMVLAMCAPIIDKSKKKYDACVANGRQGGRPQQYDPATIKAFRAQGLSHQEIANQLGCSIKTVQRALNDDVASDDDDEI